MPVNVSRKSNANGINYTYEADAVIDHALIPNSTYFRDKSDSLIYYKNAAGTVLSLFNEIDTPTTDALVHVMPSGSDVLGQRADLSKPFLTLEAASAAAIAGDTIIVYPGIYTPTANIAKSGVNFYLHRGAIIQRTTGNIFDDTGFVASCNVYGAGTFELSGADATARIYYFRAGLRTVFEAYSCTSLGSSDALFYLHDNVKVIAEIDFLNSVSRGFIGSNIGFLSTGVELTVYADNWFCQTIVADPGSRWVSCKFFINGNSIRTGTGIHFPGMDDSLAEFNIVDFTSNSSLYSVQIVAGHINSPRIVINSTLCSGVNFAPGAVTAFCDIKGYCENLVSGGTINAELVKNITCASGFTKATVHAHTGSPTIIVSGGICDLDFGLVSNFLVGPGIDFTCTGGTLNIHRCSTWSLNRGLGSHRMINGGTVNLYGDLIIPDWFEGSPYTSQYGIHLQSGTLNLYGSIRNQINQAGQPHAGHCIIWSGGTLNSHGGQLYKSAANAGHIRATVAGLQLRVLASGLSTNTNSGLLDGQSARTRVNIAADNLATQVRVMVQGDPAETFNVALAFGNQAAIAAQLVTLINASGTLNATASQDNPGVDNYFYVTNDSTGPTQTIDNLINTSVSPVREPKYPITEIVGGLIIQSSNIV